MKKNLVFIVFAFFSVLSAHAQLEKGTLLIGGTGNFGAGLSQNSSNFAISLRPNIGIFVRPKFAIGGGLGFDFQTQLFAGNSGSNYITTGLGISSFARYYFLKQESKLNLFAQAGLGTGAFFNTIDNLQGRIISISPSISGGLAYFIHPQIALEATLHVNANLSSFSFLNRGQVNVNFGFQIHLTKPPKNNQTSLEQ